MANGTEQFFEGWKKQVETGVRIMDAVVEAATKMRTAQLGAANDTHERIRALEKSLADAKTAQELWGAQWNWALASCERSAAYWRSLFEVMAQSNREMARRLQEGMQGALPVKFDPEVPSTGYPAMDSAYREMLKASRQLLEYGADAANLSQARAASPAS